MRVQYFEEIPYDSNFKKDSSNKTISEMTIVPTTFALITAMMFIMHNIAVNTFSLNSNFNEKISESPLNCILVIAGISTLFSNFFSKTPSIIGNPVNALHLNHQQKIFFHNLENKIDEISIHSGKYFLCLDDETMNRLFSPNNGVETKKCRDMLTLLQTKQEIIMTSKENLFFNIHKNLEKSEIKKIVILSSCDLSDLDLNLNSAKIICFYPHTWTRRIIDDYKTNLLQGSQTTIKASGAFMRWLTTKGVPGMVVIFTGMPALSKVEKTNTIDSRLIISFLFITNFIISYAKMHVNNELKSRETDIHTRRLIERVWHCELPKLNYSKATLSLVVNMLSMVPYNITTSLFYTDTGIRTIPFELNRIFNTSLSVPNTLLETITIAAVLTSIPGTYATCIIPFYNLLQNGWHFGSPHAKEIVKTFKITATIFLITTIIDSMIFGNNAFFNMMESFRIIKNKHPTVETLLNNNNFLEYIPSVIVGSGGALMMLFWGIYSSINNFEKGIEMLSSVRNIIFPTKLFDTRRISNIEEPDNTLQLPLITNK